MTNFLPGITKIFSRPAYGAKPDVSDQWVVYLNPAQVVRMKHGEDNTMIVTMTDGSEHTCSAADAQEWGIFDRPL